MMRGLLVTLAIALPMSACGGAPKPVDQLVQAEAALRAARATGAERVPQAQLHAKLAEEQVAQASKLMDDGDNAGAERLLQRAKADAEYALVLSRHAEVEQALSQAHSDQPNAGSGQVSMIEHAE